jgi:hypothetical protein
MQCSRLHRRTPRWPMVLLVMALAAGAAHATEEPFTAAMQRYGPQLYGTEFAATARQLERWARLWGCGGDVTTARCTQAMRAP